MSGREREEELKRLRDRARKMSNEERLAIARKAGIIDQDNNVREGFALPRGKAVSSKS